MLKSYKTEICLTTERGRILQSIGICRWLYNEYIVRNKQLYHLYQRGRMDEHQKHFLSAMDFDKFVNHKLKNQEKYSWINNCGAKSRKKVLVNAETAFKSSSEVKPGFQNSRSEAAGR